MISSISDRVDTALEAVVVTEVHRHAAGLK